jgi:hypothetical protein
LGKIVYWEKIDFLGNPNYLILGKNKFLEKKSFFGKKSIFWEKIDFLGKNLIF